MDNTIPFPSGFPLHELPELTDEVLFAFHLQIDKVLYLNAAFEKVWNVSREFIGCNLSLLFDTIHPDDRELVKDSFTKIKSDRQNQKLEFRILLPPEQQQKWIRLKAYASEKSNKEIIWALLRILPQIKITTISFISFQIRKILFYIYFRTICWVR